MSQFGENFYETFENTNLQKKEFINSFQSKLLFYKIKIKK